MIKICGIKEPEIWDHCVALGVGYLGLMFYPHSPRFVDIEQAKALCAIPRQETKTVAVVVNPDDGILEAIASNIAPDFLQLHGNESPNRVREIQQCYGIPIIKALPIAENTDFAAIDRYADTVAMFLFDAKPRPEDTLPGGNAHSFNWSLLKDQDIPKPWFLAGGITPDNIDQAVHASGAANVDLSSGVEQEKGVKSREKITALMQKVACI